MSILTKDMSDTINMADRAIMEEIAKTDDHPVLMINQNLYTAKAEFPNGELYKKWRKINKRLIEYANGQVIWTIPVRGQLLYNGNCQALSEILAFWYPSHQAFLDIMTAPSAARNMELRTKAVEHADLHRCDPY